MRAFNWKKELHNSLKFTCTLLHAGEFILPQAYRKTLTEWYRGLFLHRSTENNKKFQLDCACFFQLYYNREDVKPTLASKP